MTRDYSQFFLYVAVGVVTAVIDIAAMQATLYLSRNILLSLTISYLLAVSFNFVCHSKITFSYRMSIKVLYKYLSVVLLNYCVTVILVYVFVYFGLSALVGKLFSLPVVAISGFLLSKKWVFK